MTVIRRFIPILSAAIAILALPKFLWAEPDTAGPNPSLQTGKQEYTWVSLGLASTTVPDLGDISMLRIALNFAGKHPVFGTLSYSGYRKANWNLFGTSKLTEPSETINQVALMFGLRFAVRKFFYVSASAGVSGATGMRRFQYDVPGSYYRETRTGVKRWSAVGLPYDAHFILTPSSGFGLGIGRIADINCERPFSGFVFELLFGKIS